MEPLASPPCLFCASTDTELLSLFGQSLLTSTYYCRRCRTAFERVRWEEGEGLNPSLPLSDLERGMGGEVP